MKITDDGHVIFEDDGEFRSALRLIHGIHKGGLVNTSHEIWKQWIESDFGKKTMGDHIIVLIWCTVFLQRLMYSVICDQQGYTNDTVANS